MPEAVSYAHSVYNPKVKVFNETDYFQTLSVTQSADFYCILFNNASKTRTSQPLRKISFSKDKIVNYKKYIKHVADNMWVISEIDIQFTKTGFKIFGCCCSDKDLHPDISFNFGRVYIIPFIMKNVSQPDEMHTVTLKNQFDHTSQLFSLPNLSPLILFQSSVLPHQSWIS